MPIRLIAPKRTGRKNQADTEEPHKKEMKILGIKTEESRRSRNAYKTCAKEAPRRESFKKHKRRVHRGYKLTCNQRGNKLSSGSKLKTHTLAHENYEIDRDKCKEETTLRNNPEEYWDPGIYIGTTITGNN